MAQDYKYKFWNGRIIKVPLDDNDFSSGIHPDYDTYEQAIQASKVPETLPDTHDSIIGQAAKSLIEPPRQKPAVDNMNEPAPAPSNDSSMDRPRSPVKPILSKMELAKRDWEAVAYTKALLLEGDTLVYISYPGDSKCFDSTGFEISAAPHKVHSSRLLTTGSKVFAQLLGPTSQFRIMRRKKLVGHLPPGIKYVLDLTPPDEGDEAVELTSELSCSHGLRLWYTTEVRCCIPKSLVGGEDEVIAAKRITSYGSTLPDGSDSRQETTTGSSGTAPALPEILEEEPERDSEAWRSYGSSDPKKDLDKAIRLSIEEIAGPKTKPATKHDVPEYCPVRHRAGIARLLQVLEGKDPRLDSAPKVWTLFVLAKFFDCTAAVVDWIITWMMADLNTQFIEILPEVSCKMAFGLKNQLVCRAAFSVLVGEEALSLASREVGHLAADRRGTNQFGRVREDIDEDLRTRIEYASKNFATRVSDVAESLVEKEMSWISTLPEFQKLQRFENEVVLRGSADDARSNKWLLSVNRLADCLRRRVRSHILKVSLTSLSSEEAMAGDKHRRAEQYTPESQARSIHWIYNSLHRKERILTRFFWRMLRNVEFANWYDAKLPTSSDAGSEDDYRTGAGSIMSETLDAQEEVNKSIFEAISENCFGNGVMPPEVLRHLTNLPRDTTLVCKSSNAATRVGNHIGTEISSEARYNMTDRIPFPEFEARANQNGSSSTAGIRDTGRPCDASELTKPINLQSPYWKNKISDVDSGKNGSNWDTMDADEFLAKNHLLDPLNGLRSTLTMSEAMKNDHKSPVSTADLPIRSKAVPSVNETKIPQILLNDGPQIFQDSELRQLDAGLCAVSSPTKPNIAPNCDSGDTNNTADPFRGESQLTSFLDRMCQAFRPSYQTNYQKLRAISSPSKRLFLSDLDMPTDSLFFNLTKFFQEAKQHVDTISTMMLDTREMGFDVFITNTLLCLSQEEFKYLPLWAGGDDDDTGGVFDDTIPAALAGPNGPGPSFHTGFSSASTASSDFDTMSQRTSLNTSVGVEDGYSDHIDRRLVVADDDFHSETFSDDSAVYDRKGKAVDRSWFCTSASASVTAPSVMEGISDASTESSFDIVYNEDDDDADTTIGQADQEEEEDGWDIEDGEESFDFGDGDSDEEMVNV